MSVTVLLQARTNSSRLPAKVLLPVGGMPLVVLAARRAANTGRHVIVVTSREPTDDTLCFVLKDWGVTSFRGDLNNTLKRFVDAVEGSPDSDIIVRLTGDNVFPDGRLVDEIVEEYQRKGSAYLCCGGDKSGLPYGVSAEVTRVGFLREALSRTESQFDQEHVTPWIARRYGRTYFELYRSLRLSCYRCTVDILEDYLLVSSLFRGIEKPDCISMNFLLERLEEISTDVVADAPATKMVLGAAQLGLDYGITNTHGHPSQAIATDLVRTALKNGINYIDTANAYGDSERAIGRALSEGWGSRAKVITKLSPLNDCPNDASPTIVRAFVQQSVYQSCYRLGVSTLDVLMLHRAVHLKAWSGTLWSEVLDLKEMNVVRELGVSVQSPEEALTALDMKDISFIQLPFNILDYRWGPVAQELSSVRQQRALVVHVRSALLQGLLTTDRQDLWRMAQCSNADRVIDWLRAQAERYSGGDVVELCLRYALSQSWIDGVVIGVDTKEQLLKNVTYSMCERWGDEQLAEITAERPCVSAETLNPARWDQANAKPE